MGRVLVALSILLIAASAWVWTGMKTSFSGYSDQNLDVLEEEADRLGVGKTAKAEDARVTASLIRDERLRRRLEYPLPIAGALCLGLAVAWRFVRRPRRDPFSDEDLRLQAALGDPQLVEAGARRRAADLLGVTENAPDEVVNAAFEAQRQMNDPSRAEGLAPDLRRLLAARAEELERARDLLISRRRR